MKRVTRFNVAKKMKVEYKKSEEIKTSRQAISNKTENFTK